MNKLTEYIIDTQGVLPPSLLMANKKVFDTMTREVRRLPQCEESDFISLEPSLHYFKFRPGVRIRFPGYTCSVGLLTINDKLAQLLYC